MSKLSKIAPREQLDLIVDGATEDQLHALITAIGDLPADKVNEIFSLALSLRDVAAGAAFFAGFYAATSPGAWLLGDNSEG